MFPYCCILLFCVLAHKNLIVTLYSGSLSMGNNTCIIYVTIFCVLFKHLTKMFSYVKAYPPICRTSNIISFKWPFMGTRNPFTMDTLICPTIEQVSHNITHSFICIVKLEWKKQRGCFIFVCIDLKKGVMQLKSQYQNMELKNIEKETSILRRRKREQWCTYTKDMKEMEAYFIIDPLFMLWKFYYS